MNSTRELSASLEDYLEIMRSLEEKNGFCRVVEIARELNVKSPSVNAAVNQLRKKGLVSQEKYGFIRLSKQGRERAGEVQARHNLLAEFFKKFLELDERIVQSQACRVEHLLDHKTFTRLEAFMEYVEKFHQKNKLVFSKEFKKYIKTKKTGAKSEIR
jgi:DtxR family transcriptional regulator, Mn-dependent transcriptional regulator